MLNKSLKPLFIFEMANNHQGSVEHGLRIIREIYEVCKEFDFNYGFKLQYRDLDTFIHPDYKDAMDVKYVKRFSDTRLTAKEYKILKDEIQRLNFVSICTPFDEISVDLLEQHGFDVIKIASCSFTDWPLLEKIANAKKSIIASTAGVDLEDIDKVESFFRHRDKDLSLMHCVAEYPTKHENLQLNQIRLLRHRYPNVRIGYSTHENPDNLDSVKLAVAMGASIFEKHVGVSDEGIELNAYSATPQQIYHWLKSAKEAFDMCGVADGRHEFTQKELADLRALRRGVFVKRPIKKGEKLNLSNIFYAIPDFENQILANDMSKYKDFYVNVDVDTNKPIYYQDVNVADIRGNVAAIINQVKSILSEARIAIPDKTEFELSHHYGIENFADYGATIINCVNREYCKKIIVLVPGQKHPVHHHKLKEETFHVLYGEITINLDGQERVYKAGDIVLVERRVNHSFAAKNGAVFEEISTTHYLDDSYYDDEKVKDNKKRKTELTYWSVD